MILVNNPGGGEYYSFLQHATWNGLTFADIVFPFFIFIVGAVIPFSFTRRIEQGTTKKKLFVIIIRRTLILFALGLLINGYPTFNLATFRIMGVLQRIALCYFFASIIFVYLKPKWQILLTMAIPIVYWMLMTLVPVPGYGAGVLTQQGNLASYIDRSLLSGHLYAKTWDPEGILSTLPAVSTCLIGVLAGRHLKSERKSRAKALNLLFFSLSVEGHFHPLLIGDGTDYLRLSEDSNSLFFKKHSQATDDLFIFGRDDLRKHLKDGHLRTQAIKDGPKFNANHPTPDDDHFFWGFFQVYHVIA
jgi:predicted acyltransferase